MAERQDELSAAIRAAAAEARGARGPHVTPDELADYHERRLDAPAVERVQDHLALCAACTRLLLDLDALPALEPISEADRRTDADVARDWAALQARLASERTAARGEATPFRRYAPWAIAASLFIVALGLGLRTMQLQRRVDELSRPRANLVLADLSPLDEAVREARRSSREVRFSPGRDHALLILSAPEAKRQHDYAATVSDEERPARGVVLSRDGLRCDPDGLLTLELSRDDLPPGRYRLRLHAPAGAPLEYGFVIARD